MSGQTSTRGEAVELVDLLQGIPLAMKLARRYLNFYPSLSAYTKLYEDAVQKLLDDPAHDSPTIKTSSADRTILATWTIPYASVVDEDDKVGAGLLKLWTPSEQSGPQLRAVHKRSRRWLG